MDETTDYERALLLDLRAKVDRLHAHLHAMDEPGWQYDPHLTTVMIDTAVGLELWADPVKGAVLGDHWQRMQQRVDSGDATPEEITELMLHLMRQAVERAHGDNEWGAHP